MKYNIVTGTEFSVDGNKVMIEKEALMLDKRVTISSTNIPWLYTRMVGLMHGLDTIALDVYYEFYKECTKSSSKIFTVEKAKEMFPNLSEGRIVEAFKDLQEVGLLIQNKKYPSFYEMSLDYMWSANPLYLEGKKAKITFKIE